MINRRYLYLIAAALVVVIIYALTNKSPQNSESSNSSHSPLPPNLESKTDNKIIEVKDRKVLGLSPAVDNIKVEDLKIANEVSEDWQEGVEKALRAQGGNSLSEINIKKTDSFIWAHEGVALNVESVMITLKNQNGEERKFRAMVDSETGKILRTWDHPVIDPMNPRENRGISIDPRYHNN
jgi:hypothetical protein